MKRDKKLLSELIHLIYNASLHPEQWVNAVSRIHESMAANKSILFTPYMGPQNGGIAFPMGFTQESLEIWATKYIDKDEVGKKMIQDQLFHSGSVCTDRDIFPSDTEYQAYQNSEMYREYSIPNNLRHICVGIVYEGSPDLPATVYSAWRGAEDPMFNEQDKEWMGLLIPHISRAMGIMIRLDTARLQTATLKATLDRMKIGVILLNDELQVAHMNNSAEKILERKDGIYINENKLLESNKFDAQISSSNMKDSNSREQNDEHISGLTLSLWLNKYKKIPIDELQHFPHGATILRNSVKGSKKNSPSNKHYFVQCTPLPDTSLFDVNNEHVHYAIFISDPESVQPPKAEKLIEIYGLTETEAKISLQFVEIGSYKGVAQKLGVSENTIRWHVKNIYPKFGVYKMADLIRVVMSLGERRI